MLGRAWRGELELLGLQHGITTYPPVDLRSAESTEIAITRAFDIVVNCTGWTDVDGAEALEAEASAINAEALRHLASICARHGSLLVHYSTNYVFGGGALVPYPVDAPMRPINAYGRTKALGETILRQSKARHLLVRTSWVYAPWGRNFVRTVARAGRDRSELRVVGDQIGRPTEARHLVRATLELVAREATGTFHICDGGTCTWAELAAEVVRVTGASCSIVPCRSEQMPRPAPRPRYSVLDISATEALVGPMPHWKNNVRTVLADDRDLGLLSVSGESE